MNTDPSTKPETIFLLSEIKVSYQVSIAQFLLFCIIHVPALENICHVRSAFILFFTIGDVSSFLLLLKSCINIFWYQNHSLHFVSDLADIWMLMIRERFPRRNRFWVRCITVRPRWWEPRVVISDTRWSLEHWHIKLSKITSDLMSPFTISYKSSVKPSTNMAKAVNHLGGGGVGWGGIVPLNHIQWDWPQM